MTPVEIITDLKSRGEHFIQFSNCGNYIYSQHGKATHNTWMVQNGELKCIDCKTRTYYYV